MVEDVLVPPERPAASTLNNMDVTWLQHPQSTAVHVQYVEQNFPPGFSPSSSIIAQTWKTVFDVLWDGVTWDFRMDYFDSEYRYW